MKIWVINIDSVYEDESYNYTHPKAFKSREEAEKVFKMLIEDSLRFDFDTRELDGDVYEAYNLGWFNDGHFVITMTEVEVEE